jgi:hypothetical protein
VLVLVVMPLLHEYEISALFKGTVKVVDAPAHIAVVPDMVGVGAARAETRVEAEAVQPVDWVTVTEYTPACVIWVVLLLVPLLQLYPRSVPLGGTPMVVGEPAQIAEVVVMEVGVPTLLLVVTLTEVVPVQPLLVVMVTV